MNINKFVPFKGNVVVLDLVSGVQVMARIKDVNIQTGDVTCSNLVVFVMTQPGQMAPVPYGYPMYEIDKTVDIEANHILSVLKPQSAQQVESYNRFTSGIVAANAGALDQLQGIDFSKIGQ